MKVLYCLGCMTFATSPAWMLGIVLYLSPPDHKRECYEIRVWREAGGRIVREVICE